MITETIQSQVDLLVDLNRELASQATPDTAREVRENVKLIVELAEVQAQRILEGLETRLETLEDALFGVYGPEGFDLGHASNLAQFAVDCREDINSLYEDWGPALDRHLGEDWCEEEEAGE